MLVLGAIIDAEGTRTGYVRFRGNRVVETGLTGTDSSHGKERRVRGIVIPRGVNAHTHLGDAVFDREPPPGPLSRLVRPPGGLKFRLLAETPPARKRRAMREALGRMVWESQGAAIDFREEGVAGVELLRDAARGLPLDVVALGRPLRRPVEPDEVERLLRVANGVGLSSALEEDRRTREVLARSCRAHGALYALHASEATREEPETYLRPRPDFLVHMTRATAPDLGQVAEARIPVAVCPRSNALFGRRPDLSLFERCGVRLLLGTDNAMFHAPSLFRELEFAYTSARLARRPVSPDYLLRAAFIEGWELLGRPDAARIGPGSVGPLVLRLPASDPAYQVVARATAHLIVRPGSGGRGTKTG